MTINRGAGKHCTKGYLLHLQRVGISPHQSLMISVRKVVDIFSVHDYLNSKVIKEEKRRGTEKSGATQENKDQSEATRTL